MKLCSRETLLFYQKEEEHLLSETMRMVSENTEEEEMIVGSKGASTNHLYRQLGIVLSTATFLNVYIFYRCKI